LNPSQHQFRRLKARSFRDFGTTEPPPRRWLVEGLIPIGTVTFLSGDGGLGKSLLGQQLVMSAALGLPWCGRPVMQVKAAGFFCEDDEDEIHRRAVPIARHLGVSLEDERIREAWYFCEVGQENALMEAVIDRSGALSYQTTELYQLLRDWARMKNFRLLVLDSLHDIFAGNENVRAEARAFVQALSLLAEAIDGAVVVLAHPSLSGLDRGSGTSGSTAWHNAVRSRLFLTRPEPVAGFSLDPDLRVLKTVKSNYARVGEMIGLRRRDGVFVVRGDTVGSTPSGGGNHIQGLMNKKRFRPRSGWPAHA
jgi:RecA-family ATPase